MRAAILRDAEFGDIHQNPEILESVTKSAYVTNGRAAVSALAFFA